MYNFFSLNTNTKNINELCIINNHYLTQISCKLIKFTSKSLVISLIDVIDCIQNSTATLTPVSTAKFMHSKWDDWKNSLTMKGII